MSSVSDLGNYDKTSVASIFSHARKLTGSSLWDVVGDKIPELKLAGKGNLGVLVEQVFFNHFPPNDHRPDFPEARLELKTTGVVRAPELPGGYRAKERLVLTLINYHDLAKESWEESALLGKCGLMLLMFYLFEKDVPPHRRNFILEPMLLEKMSQLEEDIEQIKNDWLTIQGAVLERRAHELSEADTSLLGACTKSSDSLQRTSQPFSDIPAKPRAFCLKQGYMTYLLSSRNPGYVSMSWSNRLPATGVTSTDDMTQPKHEPNEKPPVVFAPSAQAAHLFEAQVSNRFLPYLGKSEAELSEILSVPSGTVRSKSFYRLLVNQILVDGRGTPLELVKEGIQLKTVRLERNAKPRESLSFPAFDYLEIASQSFEDSDFAWQIEQRFLFLVFKRLAGDSFGLAGLKFWSMPSEDRREAEAVWLKARERVLAGDYRGLPKSSESRVSHVRPHARSRLDTAPTPQGGQEVKRGFWLNREYVAEVLA